MATHQHKASHPHSRCLSYSHSQASGLTKTASQPGVNDASNKDGTYIKVSARVRPLLASEQDQLEVVEVHQHKNMIKVYTNNYFNNGERNFVFENVLGSQSRQSEVFNQCGKDLCDSFLQGKNCNIIVYGPTSTGKTFTMQGNFSSNKELNIKHMFEGLSEPTKHQKTLSTGGPNRRNQHRLMKHNSGCEVVKRPLMSPQFSQKDLFQLNHLITQEDKGLIPRVLDYIYSYSDQITDKYELQLSYLEIYNDQVTDLLDFDTNLHSSTAKTKVHSVKENNLRGVYVENLSEHRADTIQEAYTYLLYGLQRKKVFATVKNRESSRSHTVFQIKLCTKYSPTKQQKILCKFSLVDLAGSERLGEAEKTLERIEEAKYINKSLSALGNVILNLKNQQSNKRRSASQGRAKHIPYRDSKLTHILKDSLGGNSHTHIIITLSPSEVNLSETLSSMKFAHNAKSIQQHLKENIFVKDSDDEQLPLSEDSSPSLRHNINKDDYSLNSEDIVEITNYYEKKQSMKSLKEEIKQAKQKVKLPQNNKDMKILLKKTLEKLKKYQNEQKSMQDKIHDLQSALDFRDMLVAHLRELKLPDSLSRQHDSRRLTQTFSSTHHQRTSSQQQQLQQSRSAKYLHGNGDIQTLSQTVGDELAKFIENLREDMDQFNSNQVEFQQEMHELDHQKESIDMSDAQKQSSENHQISKQNISKIEEPLVYKTMHHCVDSHNSVIQNHFSSFLTPKSIKQFNFANSFICDNQQQQQAFQTQSHEQWKIHRVFSQPVMKMSEEHVIEEETMTPQAFGQGLICDQGQNQQQRLQNRTLKLSDSLINSNLHSNNSNRSESAQKFAFTDDKHPLFLTNNLINSTIIKKSSNCTSSVIDEVSFDTKKTNAGSFLTQVTAGDYHKDKRVLKATDYLNTRPTIVHKKSDSISKTAKKKTGVQNDLKNQIANQTAQLVIKRQLSQGKPTSKPTGTTLQQKKMIQAVKEGFGCVYNYKQNSSFIGTTPVKPIMK